MKKIKLLLPLVLILSLTFVACTKDKGNSSVTDTVGQTRIEASASVYENIKLTFVDAFNIYMDKYPNTKVKKLELDLDYGEYVYEVEGYNDSKEYEIKIDSVSGKVIKERSENDHGNTGELTKDHAQKVEDIVKRALKEAGQGAILKEVTMKNKNNRVEVQVEIGKKGAGDIEYKYDIEGTLLEVD